MEDLDIDVVDEKKLVSEFVLEYIGILKDKKEINTRIAKLKQKYDEQGISTKVVLKSFAKYQKERKITDKTVKQIEYYNQLINDDSKIEQEIEELEQ